MSERNLFNVIALIVVGVLFSALIFANERYKIFSSDRFESTGARVTAYAWLAVFVFGITGIIVSSSKQSMSKQELTTVPFWQLFVLHIILVFFLVGWWLLSRRPPIRQFLNLLPAEPLNATALGVAVGVGGWAITLSIAVAVGLILHSLGMIPKDLQPPAAVPWMAALPFWQKGLIILSAMTVEEAFFRGFLQKRIGLVLSTIAFALAHAGYGEPLMLIGITVVSVIIGITFYRTKNLIPCIVAHGVFDAIQLFVVIPLAVSAGGLG